MSCQPSRNPPARNQLDWEMHAPWGEALDQAKYGHGQGHWPDKTRELTVPAKPRDYGPRGRGLLLGSLALLLSAWAPLSNKGFCSASTCIFSDHLFPSAGHKLRLPRWRQWWRTSLPKRETLETRVWSLGGEAPLEEAWHPTPVFLPGQKSLGGGSQRVEIRLKRLSTAQLIPKRSNNPLVV